MVYLGLVDDDYEDYEAYEEPPMAAGPRATPRAYAPEGAEMGGGGVRTIPRRMPLLSSGGRSRRVTVMVDGFFAFVATTVDGHLAAF